MITRPTNTSTGFDGNLEAAHICAVFAEFVERTQLQEVHLNVACQRIMNDQWREGHPPIWKWEGGEVVTVPVTDWQGGNQMGAVKTALVDVMKQIVEMSRSRYLIPHSFCFADGMDQPWPEE